MKTLLFLILILFFIGCKKEPIKYKFSGIIKETISNKTISNVNLKFYQKEVNNNTFNPNYVYLGETTTNFAGEFLFEFERKKILEVKIEYFHDDFYKHKSIISASDLSTENTNIITDKLDAKAWVKIRLFNGFVEPNEQLNFYKHNVYENCINCCINGLISVPETTPDTTFTCAVLGDDVFKYTYGEVVANTSTTATILCPKGDTTSLFINY